MERSRPVAAHAGSAEQTVVGPASAGHLLAMIRATGGVTRKDLLDVTGMSRTTLYERLDLLAGAGLVVEDGQVSSTGGRPAKVVRFNDSDRVLLTFDIGQSHGRVTVCSLRSEVLAVESLDIDRRRPPAEFVDDLLRRGTALLTAVSRARVVGVGLALPSPVQTATGTLFPTPTLPGWENYPLTEHFARTWPVPLAVENDARAFALGEYTLPQDSAGSDILLGVKIATGLGAGVIVDGHVLRGSSGSSGDIGHMFYSEDGPRCTCGKRGCLAAHASGRALLRDLRGTGVRTLTDVVERVDAGDVAVTESVRVAARKLGRSLSQVVQVVNPRRVVLGGILGRHPLMVKEIGAEIRRGTITRVSRETAVSAAVHADESGTVGLCRLLMGTVYDPNRIDRELASGS